jgi:carbon monoxide dehydrogenase subunit G
VARAFQASVPARLKAWRYHESEMKLRISTLVPADPDRVFAALIDPAVLRRAIPGCESLTPMGDDTYEATLKIGVAGLKGTYTGKAAIREKHPPDALTLSFEGKGSPGFVRGSSTIALTPEDSATRVSADTDVQVGGLIAAVGSRLVEAAAKKLADDFFRQLAEQLSPARP